MPYKDKAMQAKFQRERTARRRAEFFEGKSCVDCGSVDRLELDHVNPKEKTSHRIWSWSAERISEETAKCVVRCKPCHVKKTISHDIKRAEHGTRGMYDAGCKCDPCRKAQRDYMRNWRASRGGQVSSRAS